MQICNYKDCLKQITCKKSTSNCYFDNCKHCPSIETFSKTLLKILDDALICKIEFSQWVSTDRSTLQNKILLADDFVEELCEKLKILKPHSFIAKHQSEYMKTKKENLSKGEVLALLDFSENYAYVIQDASHAFHFNNNQCTVFPVICYYKENAQIKHKSYIFLSDYLKHDTAAIYTMQRLLIPEIKNHLNVRKIMYFSDGAKLNTSRIGYR